MAEFVHGHLIEYSQAAAPLSLTFEFNPESISRTRKSTITTGSSSAARGGYDFSSPAEAHKAAAAVAVVAETFSLKILLDATDRMNDGDPVASISGIQPEIDTLRSMVEPRVGLPDGAQLLASLRASSLKALLEDIHTPVLLFVWGVKILPVFVASVTIEEQAHLPNLLPYRATATLDLQVIESNNPFRKIETMRQAVSVALNTATNSAALVRRMF